MLHGFSVPLTPQGKSTLASAPPWHYSSDCLVVEYWADPAAIEALFTARRPSATASLTLLIRTGRSADYKREMLKRLWALVQGATGAPDEEIVIGIQEVPSSQAMEMGQIMPDVASS
jgi:hypothetical protein